MCCCERKVKKNASTKETNRITTANTYGHAFINDGGCALRYGARVVGVKVPAHAAVEAPAVAAATTSQPAASATSWDTPGQGSEGLAFV